MTLSMTGYGREMIHVENATITFEIRSVNHRFLDISVKMPRTFLFLEEKLKKIIQSVFHRGRVELYISIEGNGLTQKTVKADWDIMDQYMNQLNQAKQRYNLNGETSLSLMTSFPEFLTIQEIEEPSDQLSQMLLEGTEKVCNQVLEMREKEGTYLKEELINTRLASIYAIVTQLHDLRSTVRREYQKRITERVQDYLDRAIQFDESRIQQEIVLLAEKGDITEEITRLKSHIEHFLNTIKTSEPSGRKLDFITQEMHREANTIGSKSNDAKISELAVLLKSEIEKVKEQVQNIE